MSELQLIFIFVYETLLIPLNPIYNCKRPPCTLGSTEPRSWMLGAATPIYIRYWLLKFLL